MDYWYLNPHFHPHVRRLQCHCNLLEVNVNRWGNLMVYGPNLLTDHVYRYFDSSLYVKPYRNFKNSDLTPT
jgi:hypothetical protein